MEATTACEAARRPTQVLGEMDELDKATQTLGSLMEQIEARLERVLISGEPAKTDNAVPLQCLVPLADAIRQQKRRMQCFVDQAQSILERLEL